jgi:Phosphotransferase enzyme family
MQSGLSKRPALKTLIACLTSVLSGHEGSNQVTVLERTPNSYASGCPSEIVRCGLADGNEIRLLCKYESTDGESTIDIGYEVEVYRRVVEQSGLSVPNFYGSYLDPDGRRWLVLEYIAEGTLLSEMLDSDAICAAARWLGKFHAAQDSRAGSAELQFLKVYDADYFIELSRRTLKFAGESEESFTWLPALCKKFAELSRSLIAKNSTVTHGDFYLHNLLWKGGCVYPLDWERAGVKPGEWDLACLTDGWNGHTERQCKLEYQRARWPGGPPADCEQTLGLGRLCLYFYNLGTEPGWASDREGLWYSRRLRRVGEEMGLI